MKTFLIALRSLVYMTGFVFLWSWVALTVRPFDRAIGFSLPPEARFLGVGLMVAGGVLALTCAGNFVFRGRGTPAPFDAPRQFVALGPYKYVRNPMYIGALTLLAGSGLYLHSISILLLAMVLFVFAHLFVVFYEEPDLEERFGPTYADYRKEVPRWMPRWRPRSVPGRDTSDFATSSKQKAG